VSKSVKKLEGELGVRLFERTTRRVALTADGRALLDRTSRIFGELDSLFARAPRARPCTAMQRQGLRGHALHSASLVHATCGSACASAIAGSGARSGGLRDRPLQRTLGARRRAPDQSNNAVIRISMADSVALRP
jgi:hypothetical protein